MAKKETNKKEQKVKKSVSKPKNIKLETKKIENEVFDVVEEENMQIIDNDDTPILNHELVDEKAYIGEALQQDDVENFIKEISNTEIQKTESVESETNVDENKYLSVEVDGIDSDKEKKRIVSLYRSGQTPNEDVPLIPEKRNPGNIFFKLKNKIRLFFE